MHLFIHGDWYRAEDFNGRFVCEATTAKAEFRLIDQDGVPEMLRGQHYVAGAIFAFPSEADFPDYSRQRIDLTVRGKPTEAWAFVPLMAPHGASLEPDARNVVRWPQPYQPRIRRQQRCRWATD